MNNNHGISTWIPFLLQYLCELYGLILHKLPVSWWREQQSYHLPELAWFYTCHSSAANAIGTAAAFSFFFGCDEFGSGISTRNAPPDSWRLDPESHFQALKLAQEKRALIPVTHHIAHQHHNHSCPVMFVCCTKTLSVWKNIFTRKPYRLARVWKSPSPVLEFWETFK